METLPQQPDTGKGNRCGHDPRAFRSYVEKHGWASQPFLAEMQKRIGQLCASRDPRLWSVLGPPRSEQREAILVTFQCMAAHVQVRDKLRVLRWPKREGLPIETADEDDPSITKLTGLSRDRVKDAITAGKRRGWMFSKQVRDETKTRGRPALRGFTRRFIALLGLWRQWCRLLRHLGLKIPDPPTIDALSPLVWRILRGASVRGERCNV